MNGKIMCTKCGEHMKPYISGNSCGMKCEQCGWGWVTTYISLIEDDCADYTLTIFPIVHPPIKAVRCIAKMLSCNFITAKSKMQERITLTNHAKEILTYARVLKSNDIHFEILPQFPYEI